MKFDDMDREVQHSYIWAIVLVSVTLLICWTIIVLHFK